MSRLERQTTLMRMQNEFLLQQQENLRLQAKLDQMKLANRYMKAAQDNALIVQNLSSVANDKSKNYSRMNSNESGKKVEDLKRRRDSIEETRLSVLKEEPPFDGVQRDSNQFDKR